MNNQATNDIKMDEKVGDILCRLKPDLVLMDQMFLRPSGKIDD